MGIASSHCYQDTNATPISDTYAAPQFLDPSRNAFCYFWLIFVFAPEAIPGISGLALAILMLLSIQLFGSPSGWCLIRRLLASFSCCWCCWSGTAGCWSELVVRGEKHGSVGLRTSMSDQAAGLSHHPCCFHWLVEVVKYSSATEVCPDDDTASQDHSGLNWQILSGWNCLSYMLDWLYMISH